MCRFSVDRFNAIRSYLGNFETGKSGSSSFTTLTPRILSVFFSS